MGADFANGPEAVLDLDHLRRQTFGDDTLRREVLSLFDDQLRSVSASWRAAAPADLPPVLHKLKGAARGAGAFDLAEKAERLERDPSSPHAKVAFEAAMEQAAAAIATHLAASVSQR